MAKWNLIATLFLIISPIVLAADQLEQTSDVSPGPSIEIPPEPSPGFYKYVAQCEEIVGDECGEQVLLASLLGKDVSLDCCKHLLVMGKHCDDALMELIVEFPEYKKHKYEVYFGGDEVWKKCSAMVKNPSLAPNSN